MTSPTSIVESLHVKNYRLLRDVRFTKLSPFTVLLGANGSGKSTVFDVFAFLHEAFTDGIGPAWDRRNRMAGIRSVDSDGPVSIELKYRAELDGKSRLATYLLVVGEDEVGAPVIEQEKLSWTVAPGSGRPKEILSFSRGIGRTWDEATQREDHEELASPTLLAVTALGQFRSHPRIQYLREFISGWYLSYVSADSTRTTPVSGPQRRLSRNGDNLPNVIQYLQERHPQRLDEIFEVLSKQVPQLEKVTSTVLADGRLLLQLKDRAFASSVISRFVSDGTLKLLAYLTVLYDPEPPRVIGIEEPENQLHPALLRPLAESMRAVTVNSQVMVTTHSRDFVDALHPEELWIVSRGEDGFTRVERAKDDPRVTAMVDSGGLLGDLWSERFLQRADPRGLIER
ncbi:ATPase [Gordonia spumicola]|uniref:ATPase n=1 Tax=Gordonia spumicola TaxID=589161 RepID=A0A7I9VBR1_9ACTN|nr:AAA family ATPase [Gordonia spumicola]GEE02714.1 ATPase [Gordonia spumicola]